MSDANVWQNVTSDRPVIKHRKKERKRPGEVRGLWSATAEKLNDDSSVKIQKAES